MINSFLDWHLFYEKRNESFDLVKLHHLQASGQAGIACFRNLMFKMTHTSHSCRVSSRQGLMAPEPRSRRRIRFLKTLITLAPEVGLEPIFVTFQMFSVLLIIAFLVVSLQSTVLYFVNGCNMFVVTTRNYQK